MCFLFASYSLSSQNPTYFSITSENGLPSNEVYCMIQDNKGFIWFGCDAGIYKYDGVKYKQYKSNHQRSRAFSGLTLSASGKVYAYNFSGQLFYAENDSLYCLNDWKGKVSNIVCDGLGNLWVCGDNGLNRYNEKTKTWKNYSDFDGDGKAEEQLFTRSCEVRDNVLWFICNKGIVKLSDEKIKLIPFQFPEGSVCGEYELSIGKNGTWFFHRTKLQFYRCNGETIKEYKSAFLSEKLSVSKYTDLREFSDGLLYIPTYTGLIIYNPITDTGNVIYPTKAISYVLIDEEKRYWLATLQNGIIRIPDMNVRQWTLSQNEDVSKKTNKIITANNNVYATNIAGQIACLNPKVNAMRVVSCDLKADIQCLAYDTNRSCVYFNISNTLYQLKDGKISAINTSFPSAKFIYPYKKQYLVASSFGLYVYTDLVKSEAIEWPLKSWSREITYDEIANRLFVATNDGLMLIGLKNNKWIVKDSLLKGKQINSIAFNHEQKKLYVLSFEDVVYEIDEANRVHDLFKLPSSIHATQIRLHNKCLYIASNAGLIKYDISKKQYTVIDKLSGLSSNEVLGISFLEDNIYVATSLGINQLPINAELNEVKTKLYLENILVDNKTIDSSKINLNYNQTLRLKLAGLSYTSNATFSYAYRIVSSDSTWVKLPATIESLDFQSMPYGDFVLEVKLINHLGNDSENIIVLKGRVNPPFWMSTWFMILEAVVLIVLLLLFFKYQIKKIRKKQLDELKKIKLENELRLVQQSALKAQMNPHFIFNVLNSIKGYIYDNDKKNAVLYLSNFAELMRKILHNSSYDKIKLAEELEILKIYIDLEAMQFEGEFEYELLLSNDLDIDAVQIPGLLIQPYIENAFKHGLRHKKGLKKLVLDLARKNDSLQIKISDNGIGLAASKKINETVNKSHQSFASNATERRIELLNNNNDIVHVKILDNLDEQNNVVGTIVILTIQLD